MTIATLERPVYGMSQAARLLGLRTDSLRRWVDGYERAGVPYAPVIREERTGDDLVTWGEFVEAGYLREYRLRKVSRDGTVALTDPAVAFLEKVDFAADGTRDARRLYPLGRSVPVVLDPERNFGEPTLSSGGVRTEIIAELVDAGESPGRVATIYGVSAEDVDAAVQYEHGRAMYRAA